MPPKKKAKTAPTTPPAAPGPTLPAIPELSPPALGLNKIEYARPKKPAPCKQCRGNLHHGDIRVGTTSKSPFYEGLQTRWLCMRCACAKKQGLQALSHLAGWDRMAYSVSIRVRKVTKELLSDADEAELQTEMERLETLQDLMLDNWTDEELIEVLRINAIDASLLKINRSRPDMAALLADACINGVPADCPVCASSGLMWCAGRVACLGYMGGFTRCTYIAPKEKAVDRFSCFVPDALLQDKWLMDVLKEQKTHMVVPASCDPAAATESKPTEEEGKGEEGGDEPLPDCFVVAEVEALSHGQLKNFIKARGEEGVKIAAKRDARLAQLKALLRASPALPAGLVEGSWKLADCKMEAWIRGVRDPGRSKGDVADACAKHSAKKPTIALADVPNSQPVRAKGGGTGEGEASAKGGSSKPQKRARDGEGEGAGPPMRAKPDAGSPILKVHKRYPHDGTVVVDDNGVDVYNAPLSQVHLAAGVNRFYVLQLLCRGKSYDVFCHWGRIGATHAEWSMGSKDTNVYNRRTKQQGIALFKAWFLKKTGNEWDQRHNFKQHVDGYSFVELSTEGPAKKRKETDADSTNSKLLPSVQKVVNLLFDEDTILGAMKTSGVNCDKMPLGAITQDRIHDAFTVLALLRLVLEAPVGPTDNDVKVRNATIEMHYTKFYNVIPTVSPVPLDTLAKLDSKLEQLDLLSDILLARSHLDLKSDANAPKVDVQYSSLKCDLKPVHRTNDKKLFNTIERYFQNTVHGEPSTKPLGMFGFNSKQPKVLGVFSMDRAGSGTRHQGHAKIGNRKLLWHGTNVAVGAAICMSGLRIMPHSGGRVGKGIYLASESAKSGAYCSGSSAQNTKGQAFMFLAEAALGKQYEVTKDSSKASSLVKAPPGYDSVHAVGRTEPDPAQDTQIELPGTEQPVSVPQGKPIKIHGKSKNSFTQSEYLVYQESQVRLRFLVHVQL